MTPGTYALVAVGAAVGSCLRYLAGRRFDGGPMPAGTIAVNIVGSFLLGLFSALALGGSVSALLATGFCGGFTTYSAFAVQVHDRGPRLGSLTVLVTVVPALLVCWIGFWLGAQA